MGNIFGKPKSYKETVPSLDEEKKETAAKKQRLLMTGGASQGEKVGTNQGSSIRKIFGN